MGWKQIAAGLGTQGTVDALKAAERQVSKKKYKRMIASAVAQLLALHPDIGPKKARRRARRLTGARPSRKLMQLTKNVGWKEGAEALATVAATAGVAKAAGYVGDKLKEKLSGTEEGSDREDADGSAPDDGAGELVEEHPGRRH